MEDRYKQVSWYGRGPHECYPDRIYGAPLRVYSVPDAGELHTPYIFPGPSSPHAMISLTRGSRKGLQKATLEALSCHSSQNHDSQLLVTVV